MDTPVISVIIPVYNNASFLPKCINSVIAQTFIAFELLLIDDGSIDESGFICDEYCLLDDRVRVFHQKNSGVSVARNKGLKEAKGTYVCFIDSDDYVDKFYLENLYNKILSDFSRGLIVQGAILLYNGEQVNVISFLDEILIGEDIGNAFTKFELYTYGYPWSKLYNLSIIKKHGICFNECVDHLEDLIFMIEYVKHVDYIKFCRDTNYVYNVNMGSLSNRNRSYLSEKTSYELLKKCMLDIQNLFNLSSSLLKNMEEKNALCLIRALPALYRPPYLFSRKKRIMELRSLTDYDFEILKRTYYPYRFFERIGVLLLNRHCFIFYDAYMSFVFFMRYKLLNFKR